MKNKKTALGFFRQCMLLIALAILIAALPSSVFAADNLINQKALASLKAMSDALGKAKAIEFTAYSLYDDFEKNGVKFKRGLIQEVTLRRPNRLHYRSTSDDGTIREAWYDGKTFTAAIPTKKIYGQVAAPGTVDELIDFLQDNYRVAIPAADLLYSDIYGKLKEILLSGVFIGDRYLDGLNMEYVSFETKPADLLIWIEKGTRPVPRRMVINFVAVKGEPELFIAFKDWKLGYYVNDGRFQFTPPKGWKKVDLPKQ